MQVSHASKHNNTTASFTCTVVGTIPPRRQAKPRVAGPRSRQAGCDCGGTHLLSYNHMPNCRSHFCVHRRLDGPGHLAERAQLPLLRAEHHLLNQIDRLLALLCGHFIERNARHLHLPSVRFISGHYLQKKPTDGTEHF